MQEILDYLSIRMQTLKYSVAGKGGEPFNIHLNNHIKDVKDVDAIETDKHFTLSSQIHFS